MSPEENQQLLNSATKIIVRDFNLDEDKAGLVTQKEVDHHRLKEVLSAKIAYLIDHNLEKLKWILYRIDVDEARLHEILSQTKPADAPGVIADKIIERQLEKAKTRELYRRGQL